MKYRKFCIAVIVFAQTQTVFAHGNVDPLSILLIAPLLPFICGYQAVRGAIDPYRATCSRRSKPTPEEQKENEIRTAALMAKQESERLREIPNVPEIPSCARTGVNHCGASIRLSYCWLEPKTIDEYWEHTENFCKSNPSTSTGTIALNDKLILIERPYRRSYLVQDADVANFKLKSFCIEQEDKLEKCVVIEDQSSDHSAIKK